MPRPAFARSGFGLHAGSPARSRRLGALSALMATLMLAGCWGSDEEASPTPTAASPAATDPATPRARTMAVDPARARWSAVRTLPLVPVSAANLPDGRVLMWSAEEKFSFGGAGRTYTLTFDPVSGAVAERLVTETGHDMFCPGTTNLADGRLLVNGGLDSARTSIFDPATGTWRSGATMNIPRGYQANTLLADGSVLTLGGSWSGGVGNKHGEVWTEAGGWRRLSGVPIDSFLSPDPSRNFGGDSHFWLIPAGNGRVFHAGPGVNMHWIDPTGTGAVEPAGRRGDDEFSVSGTTVMYDASRVLKTGGGPGYDSVQANANTYVIDLAGGATVRKVAPMAYRRAFHNSVVLPDGRVVILGGQTYAVGFSDANAVLAPEIWDPQTETFATLPAMSVPRNYHSIALLLPDGRVLSAGGGLCGAGCAANHPDLQILSPPYLFNADGSAATRPLIQRAPERAGHGEVVEVQTDSPVEAFSIVRLSSTTHTVNNDQRRLPLGFRALGGNRYAVEMPSNPGLALPGHWMLFALNAAGTPSVSTRLHLTLDGSPAIAPVADQSAAVGAAVDFAPRLTLPAGTVATWRASGLPDGVTIDAASGRLRGTPTVAGTFRVSVFVTAATGTGASRTVSTDFVWRVGDPRATRFVRLEALSEVNGNPWSSAAEIELLGADGRSLPRVGWSARADSAETTGENGAAANVLDGNPATIWHTEWSATNRPLPHWIEIDLKQGAEVTGLRYRPRTGSPNGTIGRYRVLLSADGSTWSAPVASGDFAALGATADEKVIHFETSVARGRSASQSSQYEAGAAARAVDGNTDGNWGAGSVTHTLSEAGAWWEVDLGRAHDLHAIRLWNRSDCCADRLANFHVFVSATPMSGRTLAQLLADPAVWRQSVSGGAPRALRLEAAGARGRFVRVQLAGTNFLQLAEVEVHGRPAPDLPPPVTLPTLQPITVAPVVAGTAVSWTAQPSIAGSYQYQWDFGDGSAPGAWSDSASASRSYAAPGVYTVTVTLRTTDGRTTTRSFWQVVQGAVVGQAGRSSSPLAVETRSGAPARLWAVNPDHGSISVFDLATNSRLATLATGAAPRTLALAPDGRIWVVNRDAATISIVSPTTLAVVQTVALPRASQPHGLVIGADGQAWVTLEAAGRVLRLSAAGAVQASAEVGLHMRHLALQADGRRLLAARFISPPLPGEGTATVDTTRGGGEVAVLDAATLARQSTVWLRHSERPDTTVGARGIPNYLGAPVIAPDGRSAWLPSKQDNLRRGALRDGQPLTFESTLRAVSSRIDLGSFSEDTGARIDHDNGGVASAAVFHPSGGYLFVALEASRQIAVVDPAGRRELLRVDAGRAPQGLALAPDGLTLYVQNFMDRSIGVHDLRPLLQRGEPVLPLLQTMAATAAEVLPAPVLRGKQLFYDARDPRLARDGYISCAACHHDGSHDGRTWDFTSLGEGLRNTPSLRGRAGAQGRLHWSANFDEVQDFEHQIRTLQLGTGLMTDAQFATGSRNQTLGDRKSGVSADLDALAAYVGSLSSADPSPLRAADGALTAEAQLGRQVFATKNCAQCHGGTAFTSSGTSGNLMDIGTLLPSSGQRLGGALAGIDVPTLRDVWATAPYLHDGRAATLAEALAAHRGVTLTPAETAALVAYLPQIGREEASAPTPPVAPPAVQASPLFGGTGGLPFTDPVAAGQRLTGVTVNAGWWIDGLQAQATPSALPWRGGTGGGRSSFTLASGETLVGVRGEIGDGRLVSKLSFVTSTGRVLGPYGLSRGFSRVTSFSFTVPAGQRIVGFTGRSAQYLDAIGVLYTAAP